MKPKTLAILVLLAALALLGAYMVTRPMTTTGSQSAGAASKDTRPAIFPMLAARANDVAEIIIKRPEMTFTIKKDPGETGLWRVVEKANHPARLDTVRAFIIALSQLREVEQKTSCPELYSKLGVEDPIAPPAVSGDTPMPQSTLVTLKDATGATIASAVFGQPKWGTAVPGIYLRRIGEPAAWLAEGRIEVQRDPIKWTEDQFANINAARIQSITITPPPLPPHESPLELPITIARRAQSDKLAIQNIPAGRELKDPGVPDSFASILTTLPFQDVAPLSTVDFSGASEGGDSPSTRPGTHAELRTFDGLIVTIQSVARDGRTWWKLVASVDESIPAQVPPPADQDALKSPAAMTLEALKKEAAELNARWSLYAYAPVDWKARLLNHTMTELLRDTPTPSPAQPPALSPLAPTAPPANPQP